MSNKIDKNVLKYERGQRVRFIRKSLMKMTTEKFAYYCGVARSTVTNWESGFKNGLTVFGAEKIIGALQEKGITCTTVWLFYNIGPGPEIHVESLETCRETTNDYCGLETIPVSYEGTNDRVSSFEEIALFKKRYKEHLVHQVINNDLSPFSYAFDRVGGVKLSRAKFLLAKDIICIVLLNSNKCFIGKVMIDDDSVQQISVNVRPFHPKVLLLTNISLNDVAAIAPITRIWREECKRIIN